MAIGNSIGRAVLLRRPNTEAERQLRPTRPMRSRNDRFHIFNFQFQMGVKRLGMGNGKMVIGNSLGRVTRGSWRDRCRGIADGQKQAGSVAFAAAGNHRGRPAIPSFHNLEPKISGV